MKLYKEFRNQSARRTPRINSVALSCKPVLDHHISAYEESLRTFLHLQTRQTFQRAVVKPFLKAAL